MRPVIALMLASGAMLDCASKPPPSVPPDAPMYSTQEWSEMHADKSVPEIPDQQIATTDPDAPAPNENTQTAGRVVIVPIANGAGNTGGSSTGDNAAAAAPSSTIRPTIAPAKPKSH